MKKLIVFSMALASTAAFAQTHDMAGMDMGSMDMSKMNMSTSSKIKTAKAKSSTAKKAIQTPSAASKKSISKKTSKPVSQTSEQMDHGSMDMSNMDHSSMDMSKMDHSKMNMGNMDHGSMAGMGQMQGGKAPKDARDPDYSQGRDYGPIAPPAMMGNGSMMSTLFDQLEVARDNKETMGRYKFDGWVGTDWNRLAVKADGEIANSKLEDATTELLWRKPLNIFWNTEVGIRQDSGLGKDQTWLALGINGISPYWIDLSASFYVGKNSQTALKTEATYDWRILQRLVLQPSVEASFYGKTDTDRKIGQGLSDIQAGLRLRYEVSRQFAPYFGVETVRQYGKTAELLKADGESTRKTMAVAGVRFWF